MNLPLPNINISHFDINELKLKELSFDNLKLNHIITDKLMYTLYIFLFFYMIQTISLLYVSFYIRKINCKISHQIFINKYGTNVCSIN